MVSECLAAGEMIYSQNEKKTVDYVENRCDGSVLNFCFSPAITHRNPELTRRELYPFLGVIQMDMEMSRALPFREDSRKYSASQITKSQLLLFYGVICGAIWNIVEPNTSSQFETFAFSQRFRLFNRHEVASLTS
jgi:hypothetical protein